MPIPTLYNDALIELSTQPDCSMVAPSLPTYSHLGHPCTEVAEAGMSPFLSVLMEKGAVTWTYRSI